MTDETRVELPRWFQWEDLHLAEEFKRKHEKVYFLIELVSWDEKEMLEDAHPEIDVWEQKDGDAFVKMAMTTFEMFDYAAWRFMDRRARASRECRHCGNKIPRGNLAYCCREHQDQSMAALGFGRQFKK